MKMLDVKPIIEVAQKAAEPQIVNNEGVSYFVTGSRDLRLVSPPQPEPLKVFTLNSIIEYLSGNRDGIDLSKAIVNIQSEHVVLVLGPLHPKLRHRETYVQAQNPYSEVFTKHMGAAFSPEAFNIMLRTTFDLDGDRIGDLLDVQKFVGNIKGSTVRTNKDDGFSQHVTVAQGVARIGEAQIENPVMLTPLVTFPEAQCYMRPLPFIIRLHDNGAENEPSISLRLADKHGWEFKVIEATRMALVEMLGKKQIKVPVIG
jgi:hypothetical protein